MGTVIDYFAIATALTRAEAAPTLAKVAQKSVALRLIKNRAQETCCCSAYKFPHRAGGGNCPAYMEGPNEIEAEDRDLFDRAEARAINKGFN